MSVEVFCVFDVGEEGGKLLVVRCDAVLLEEMFEHVFAGMFSDGEFSCVSDECGGYRFVGLGVFQYGGDVYARFVGEDVVSDEGLCFG